jgi:hypothetical protein
VENEPEATTEELDENALFNRLKGWFQDDWDHHSDWMDEAKEDFDFVADNQWTDEQKAILEEQGRPASTFNRVQPVVDSICGFEVGNRNEVRYFPRKLGASGLNEMLTNAASWFRDQANADYEESDAFRDAVICGRGVTETRIDYTVSLDGEPRIERVDPLETFPDKDARKPNYGDARRIWRVRKLPLSEATTMFPDAQESDLHASWATGEAQTSPRSSTSHDYRVDSENGLNDDDLCTVIECQWYDVEPFVRFIDGATGEEVVVPEVEFAMLMTRLEMIGPEGMMMMGIAPPLSMVNQKKRVYKKAFIGKILLEGVKPTAVEGAFTYKFMTGKRDQTQGHFYGVVRTMKDPQRWTNKLFSQIMHILNSSAKGGIMAERGAFEDDREASESWARSDSITWLERGGIQKIQPKPTSTLPAGQAEMLQFAMSSMPLVTGVNMEMLGMKDVAQAGVLEYQRRQAGVTILAPLFDSLRRYRVDQGRLMLLFIQAYLADGRLVKIIENEQIQYLPLNRDQALGEYEVIVDEAPNSPNAKDRNFAVIQSLWPMLQPAMTPQIAAEVVKYSPLPESLASKISEQLLQPQEPPPDPKMMELQAKMQMSQQDKQFEMAKLEREYQLRAEIEFAKAERDAQIDRDKYTQQIQIEVAQGEADAAVKRLEVEYQNNLNERKFQLEANLKQLDYEMRRDLEMMKAQPSQGGMSKEDQTFLIERERLAQARDLKLLELQQSRELAFFKKGGEELPDGTVVPFGTSAFNQVVEAVNSLSTNLDDMRAMETAPRRVVRDPETGGIVGVEIVGQEGTSMQRVVRDPDTGRVVGVETVQQFSSRTGN